MKGRYKYILTVLLALAAVVPALRAQHYVGVRGGYGSGTSQLYTKPETGSVGGLFNGGISWKYFTAEKIAGGIEFDLLFMQQGFKYYRKNWDAINGFESFDGFESSDTTQYYSRTVNSVMLPFFWHPHVYLFGQRLRVFGNAGVTFSVNINSRYQWGSDVRGKQESGKYEMKAVRDNRFGYGLCGGAGMGWSFGRFEVFGEWRYYFGFSDIWKNKNKYVDSSNIHSFLRSPLHSMQVNIGVYYRLGEGGILSPVGPKTAEKMQIREQRRAAKRAGAYDPVPVADD